MAYRMLANQLSEHNGEDTFDNLKPCLMFEISLLECYLSEQFALVKIDVFLTSLSDPVFTSPTLVTNVKN